MSTLSNPVLGDDFAVFNDFHPSDPNSVRPFIYEDAGTVSMHFDICEVQSRMRLDDPYALELDYTRTLMGFLLFEPLPRSILMIGLGGGSLPKYCHRHLPLADITVVEINPHVIAMRDSFHVPADDQRFRVVHADGAAFIAAAECRYDVVLLDGFTCEGQPETLCSQAFYQDCKTTLAETGVMAVNLHAEGAQLLGDRIARCFEDATLSVQAEGGCNLVVFAGGAVRLAKTAQQRRRHWRSLPAVHQHTLRASAGRLTGPLQRPGCEPEPQP